MRYLKNIFFLFVGFINSIVLNFFQIKLLTLSISPFELGEYFAFTGMGIFTSQLFLLGINWVANRFIPQWESSNDNEKISTFGVLTLSLFIFLNSFLWTVVLILPFPKKLHLLLGLWVGLSFNLLFIFSSLFNSLRQMHYTALIHFLYLFPFIGLIFLNRHNLSVLLLLCLNIVCLLFAFLWAIVFFFIKYHKIKLALFIKIFKETYQFWKFSALLSLLSPVFLYSDRILLALFKNYNDVSLFTILRKVVKPVEQVLYFPLEALAPEITYRIKDSQQNVGLVLQVASKTLSILALHSFVFFLFAGRFVIEIVSTSYYLESFSALLIFSFGSIIRSIYSPFTLSFRARGKIQHYFYSDLFWVFIYLILSYPLISSAGIMGMSLVFLLSNIFTLVFNVLFLIPKYPDIRIPFISIVKGFRSSFIALFISMSIFYITRMTIPGGIFIGFGIFYLAFFYLTKKIPIWEKEEREILIKLFQKHKWSSFLKML